MAAITLAGTLGFLALLALMLGLAKAAGWLCERVHFPSVIGEIAAGMAIGPSALALLDPASPDYGFALEGLAQVGIIVLIFCVGLETRLSELKKVGRVALSTATAGVITPLAAGAALLLALSFDWRAALFVGAAMVATSVGITARVMDDLKMAQSVPSRIILGAAVIDDVLGMVVLALVGAVAVGSGASPVTIAVTMVAATAFVTLSLFAGPWLVDALAGPRPASLPPEGRVSRAVLMVAAGSCVALAVLAAGVGLASIIGAFLAGVAFADVQDRYRLVAQLDNARRVLPTFFFVLMGAKVSLGVLFADPWLLALALTLTVLAAVTKYVPCYLAARGHGRAEARVVGAGMIPRGEVGLIVGATALGLGLVTPALFSVVVFMALGTSLLGPPLLRHALRPTGVHGPLTALKIAHEPPG